MGASVVLVRMVERIKHRATAIGRSRDRQPTQKNRIDRTIAGKLGVFPREGAAMESSRCRVPLLVAALAATVLVTLGVRTADAAGQCGAPGATCKMNRQCCSGTCVGGSAMGKPSGTCGGANGSPCSSNGQCVSNHCVGGVCCNTACTGQCDGSCSTGTCAPASAGTPCNDGNFCTVTDACNASRSCVGLGNPCAGTSQCT